MPNKILKLNKKIILLSAALLALAVVIGIITAVLAAPIADTRVAAYVENYPIYIGEMRLAIEQIKSDTVMYFIDTYGAVQGKDFWEQEFDGENPREKLIGDALMLAARYKKEQIMMLDFGVITEEEMSFEAFCEELKSENQSRREAEKNGEIIYGPTQYTKQGYYDYLHNNRLLDLRWRVNEKITGDNSLTYETANFEQQYALYYADKEIVRVEKAIARLKTD